MSARDELFARVRAAVSHKLPRPAPFEPARRKSDFAAFAAELAAAGGVALGPLGPAALGERVAALCRELAPERRTLASDAALLRLGSGPWQPVPADADPHALADVAIAIVCGALGVAENGAVGLDGREARPRALPVICEHLVILLETRRLVPEMHAALAALPEGALAHHHFTFVAGPSKTADIEGELVLGAHGPRSLTVVGIDAEGG
ncbi:MAG TPA: LUD domain-containing protein [Myxococcota bacterium]|nr:LUD domain-containing protein [Myxococcota bacterium]